MKVLVTGAGGQLGRALGPALREHEVVALAHSQLDITHPAAVREALQVHRPDLVLNAAAYNAVDRAETDREQAFRANCDGPRVLAEAAEQAKATILHVSSDYVFDGEKGAPYDEMDRPRPLSVYGESKLAGERAVRAANPRHFIVRTAWVYAHGGKNFPLTILALGSKGPVRVVDDQRGSPTYAPHLAEGIARLVATEAFGTWHLAGGGEASWYELTCELFRLRRMASPASPIKTADFPRPARRPRRAPLVSLRQPPIRLPTWQEGLLAFASSF
ncbi:MAG TPA: dTDP-4-dehydrorhamnose reductase [Vicinamibacteria bacterium]